MNRATEPDRPDPDRLHLSAVLGMLAVALLVGGVVSAARRALDGPVSAAVPGAAGALVGLAGLVTCAGPGRWGSGPWWLGVGFGMLVLVVGWRLLGWGDDAVARLPHPSTEASGWDGPGDDVVPHPGREGDLADQRTQAGGVVPAAAGWATWEAQARRHLMTVSRVSAAVREQLLTQARELCGGREPSDELGDAGAWAASAVRSDPRAARSHAGWTAVGFLVLAVLSLPWPVWAAVRGQWWGRPAAWMLCTLLWLVMALVYVRRWRAGAR